jgi:hypothetical protein
MVFNSAGNGIAVSLNLKTAQSQSTCSYGKPEVLVFQKDVKTIG